MQKSRQPGSRRPSSSPSGRSGASRTRKKRAVATSSERRTLKKGRTQRPSNARGHGAKAGFVSRTRAAFRSFLTHETKAGFLLIGVAMAALIIANSPLNDIYQHISHYEFGPDSLGMHLSVHQWLGKVRHFLSEVR